MLKNLCKEYTDLNQQELDKLARLEEMLPLIADLMNADVFIDCLTRDPDVAVVAAEAKPKSHPSLYQGSVAGQLALRKNEPAALRTLEIGMETRDLKALTQEQIMVKQSVVPIKFGEKVIGALIMEQDVTNAMNQNARMEILSETAEQLTQTLMNFQEGDGDNPITHHLNDAILVFDQDGLSTYANPVAEELYRKLGYLDRITGMHFDNLSLNETKFRNLLENQNLAVSEINIGGLTLQVKYARMRIGGNQKGIIMLIRDVTEVKEKEKELILKSVAIREIHHRVKNNLQTIASLLRLQSRRLNDQESKIFFQESINRVLSMAATHEILAQNGVDDVDIMTLLLKLKASTFNFESRPD
ncbi:MAG TPA: histidine kinase N-terminal domain-containing protein, partial [Clostridia bacterium]|nr:histidine kinase N-terminal domain-containing protein [Clostridia bacterium]